MTYRILSLDGGGTWALLQAMVLEDIYDDAPGLKILEQFDLVAANSGGSIVLAGLIENKRPSDIFKLFEEARPRRAIFVSKGEWSSLLSRTQVGPIIPQFLAASKLAGLEKAFGVKGLISLDWENIRLGPLGSIRVA